MNNKTIINKSDSLGINNYCSWYIQTLPNQNKEIEFKEIEKFLNFILQTDTIPIFKSKHSKRIEFINYGRTQLVFVITIDELQQFAILISQPCAEEDQVKKEYENLLKLSKNNPNVIKPITFFVDPNKPNRQAYVTPYIYQARCIGICDTEWGMWKPDPEYHFEISNKKLKHTINVCMIALLISFYNEDEKTGVSKIRLDGDDFMLKKGFENLEINNENIINNMIFIAARNLINIEFNEYKNILKKELLRSYSDKDTDKIIVSRLKSPMTQNEIDEGINYGIFLKENKKII